MDNDTLREVARFTTLARKIIGRIDPIRLSNDVEYAKETFTKVQAEGDEEVITLSIKLSGKFVPTVKQDEKSVKYETDKYRYGARS